MVSIAARFAETTARLPASDFPSDIKQGTVFTNTIFSVIGARPVRTRPQLTSIQDAEFISNLLIALKPSAFQVSNKSYRPSVPF